MGTPKECYVKGYYINVITHLQFIVNKRKKFKQFTFDKYSMNRDDFILFYFYYQKYQKGII